MDNRIFHKQCKSIAGAGFSLQYIAQSAPNFNPGSITHVEIPKFKGRLSRFLLGSFFILFRLTRMDTKLIHIHDPELFFMGAVAKCFGQKVVIDIHEDLPTQIMAKAYLPQWSKPILRTIAKLLYRFADFYADAVVVATPHLGTLFKNKRIVVVQNFPRIDELTQSTNTIPYRERKFDFVYIGAITKERGVFEMLKVAETLSQQRPIRFLIAGPCTEEIRNQVVSYDFVEYHQWMDRSEVSQSLSNAKIGFVLLHPIENYLVSQPTKMYEYMTFKVPYIASDFKFWMQDTRLENTGVFVDPFDSIAVAEKAAALLDNPEKAEEIGLAGFKSVSDHFSWANESESLIALYDELLGALVSRKVEG
jgi:glycosyltransferase involved in cell wall biosynthesis